VKLGVGCRRLGRQLCPGSDIQVAEQLGNVGDLDTNLRRIQKGAICRLNRTPDASLAKSCSAMRETTASRTPSIVMRELRASSSMASAAAHTLVCAWRRASLKTVLVQRPNPTRMVLAARTNSIRDSASVVNFT